MERHQGNASDAGHSQAQIIRRELFDRSYNVSKEVVVEEGKSDDNQENEKSPPHME